MAARGVEQCRAVGGALGDDAVAGFADDDIACRDQILVPEAGGVQGALVEHADGRAWTTRQPGGCRTRPW